VICLSIRINIVVLSLYIRLLSDTSIYPCINSKLIKIKNDIEEIINPLFIHLIIVMRVYNCFQLVQMFVSSI